MHHLIFAAFFLLTLSIPCISSAATLTSNAVPAAASFYSPGKVVVARGSKQVYVAKANPGYTFDYWSGCDSVSGANLEQCTVYMNKDKTVTAFFKTNGLTYQLSASASPVKASWWSPGTTTFPAGSTVTYTAVANPGWTFSQWTGCDAVTGNKCTVVMNTNRNVSATFMAAASSAYPELTPQASFTSAVSVSKSNNSVDVVHPNTPITKQDIQAMHSGVPSNNAAVGGNAVSMANGHFSMTVKDMSIKSNGLPFDFIRYYSSVHLVNQGSLGAGWTHSFDVRIINQVNTTVDLQRPDGSLVRFAEQTNQAGIRTFQPAVPGVYDTLTQNANGYFTLTKKNKTSYSFDETGLLLSITDANGNALKITNDPVNYRPTQITDSRSGRWLKLTYNNGYLRSITDNAGRSVSYWYNPAGQLVSVTDVRGKTGYYFYDGFGQMYKAIDPLNNNKVDNQYYSNAQVGVQKDALGISNSFTFNSNGTTTETDRMGNIWTYQHNSNGFLVTSKDPYTNTTTRTYNAKGNPISVTDSLGRKTLFTYDAMGNMLTKTNPAGETFTYTYDNNNNVLFIQDPYSSSLQNRTISTKAFTYDASNNLLTKTDFRGNKTTFTYTPNGQVKTVTDPRGNTTNFNYFANGDLKQVVDAYGNITSFGYDVYGNVSSVTDPYTNTWSRVYDPAGNLLSEKDPLGNTTTYTYDANGRLKTVTTPNNQGTNKKTTYNYDKNGNLISKIDPLGNITTYQYDKEERLTTTTIAANTLFAKSITKLFDAAGRDIGSVDGLQHRTSLQLDAAGQISTSTNPRFYSTFYTYDQAGRVTQILDALNGVHTKSYDINGRLKSETDPLQRTTKYQRDADGRIIRTTDPLGGSTTSTYDSAGNLIATTDAKGNTTQFVYDALNRRIQEKDALGKIIKTAYDPRGLVKSHTNARGQTIFYGYDTAGRLTTETFPTYTLTHTLDKNGNRTKTTSSLGPVISRTFDALDRLKSRTDQWKNTVSYTYTPAGNISTITYPDNSVVTYHYDAANRLTSVVDWAGRTTSYTYDAANNLKTASLPDGTLVSYTYDALNQLTGKTDTNGGVTIADYIYTLDAAGQQIHVSGTFPLQPVLTPANHGSFTYDADNRLTARGADTFAYDADSNMTSRTVAGVTKTLTWNVLNQLTAYGADSFIYDADGYRVGSTINGVTRHYVQDTNGKLSRLLMEQDANGATIARYVYGIGLLYRVDSAGNMQVYHFDRRGSTVALTDATGNITDTFAYDPFGKLTNRTGTTQQPFTYNGRDGVVDDGNGLYFMRTRYFDAELMRFISKDMVVGFTKRTQSMNRFAYANGNPTNRIDPIGMYSLDEFRNDVNNAWDSTKSLAESTWNSVTSAFSPNPTNTENFSDRFFEQVRKNRDEDSLISTALTPIYDGLLDGNQYVTDLSNAIGTDKVVTTAIGIAGSAFIESKTKLITKQTGDIGAWIRLKPSYDRIKNQPIELAITVGSNEFYRNRKIKNPLLKSLNKKLRNTKLPGQTTAGHWTVCSTGAICSMLLGAMLWTMYNE